MFSSGFEVANIRFNFEMYTRRSLLPLSPQPTGGPPLGTCSQDTSFISPVRYEEKCGTKRGVEEEEMDTTGDEKESKKEKKEEGTEGGEKKDRSTFKG